MICFFPTNLAEYVNYYATPQLLAVPVTEPATLAHLDDHIYSAFSLDLLLYSEIRCSNETRPKTLGTTRY